MIKNPLKRNVYGFIREMEIEIVEWGNA